jgi:hypothetical protein
MNTTDWSDEQLGELVDGLRNTHEARSEREGWRLSLAAAGRWGARAAVRRMQRPAHEALARERGADWCRGAAQLLDNLDTGRRWAVVDMTALGLESRSIVGFWTPGLAATFGVEADDALAVNLPLLVRSRLPATVAESPADLDLADVAAGWLVRELAVHEAAHAIQTAPAAAGPALELLRAVVPTIPDTRRHDHHGPGWARTVAVLASRAARSIDAPAWLEWWWQSISADLSRNTVVGDGERVLDALAPDLRRPFHADLTTPPPGALVAMFDEPTGAHP